MASLFAGLAAGSSLRSPPARRATVRQTLTNCPMVVPCQKPASSYDHPGGHSNLRSRLSLWDYPLYGCCCPLSRRLRAERH